MRDGGPSSNVVDAKLSPVLKELTDAQQYSGKTGCVELSTTVR
jgi:hypothetical protein